MPKIQRIVLNSPPGGYTLPFTLDRYDFDKLLSVHVADDNKALSMLSVNVEGQVIMQMSPKHLVKLSRYHGDLNVKRKFFQFYKKDDISYACGLFTNDVIHKQHHNGWFRPDAKYVTFEFDTHNGGVFELYLTFDEYERRK